MFEISIDIFSELIVSALKTDNLNVAQSKSNDVHNKASISLGCEQFATISRLIWDTFWRQKYDIATIITLRSHRMGDKDIFATVARMSYDCRTNHWRMFHDIRATFVRHSRDTRTMFARWNCEHLLPSTASRRSHERRATVARCFARNDKPRKINI